MARKKKKVPGLNSSSTADISFILLIFFLVTTSMDTDMGLARRLPQPPEKDQEDAQIDVKERNVLNVRLNAAGNLMCNHDFIDIKELRPRAKEFIENKSVAAVGGSWVCKKDDILNHDWDKITMLSENAVKIIKETRK